MREINAKYDGVCAETGRPIHKGDRCLYDPRHREVYNVLSETYRQFREQRFAQSWGMADANW